MIRSSFNWSPAAAHTNDETLLVIHSPLMAAHFTSEMDRLWRGAELGDHATNKMEAGPTASEMQERSPAQGDKPQHWCERIKFVWL